MPASPVWSTAVASGPTSASSPVRLPASSTATSDDNDGTRRPDRWFDTSAAARSTCSTAQRAGCWCTVTWASTEGRRWRSLCCSPSGGTTSTRWTAMRSARPIAALIYAEDSGRLVGSPIQHRSTRQLQCVATSADGIAPTTSMSAPSSAGSAQRPDRPSRPFGEHPRTPMTSSPVTRQFHQIGGE